MQSLKVYLNKKYILDKKISPEAFAVYVALEISAHLKSQMQSISKRGIFFKLFGSFDKYNQRHMKKIDNGIKEISEKYIPLEIFGSSEIVFDTELIKPKSRYICVDTDDIETIMNFGGGARFDILKYYTILIDSIIQKYTVSINKHECKSAVIGNKSINDLSILSGYSPVTVVSYNKFLEEHKIIYINQRIEKNVREGYRTEYVHNTYGKYEDKDYVDKYVKNMYGTQNMKDENINKNYGRSMTQKYNYLKRTGHTKCSTKELEELYLFVKERNENIKDIIENITRKMKDDSLEENYLNYCKNKIELLKSDIKDLSVFEKHGINIQQKEGVSA